MKKIYNSILLLALMLGAVSCQDNGLDDGQVIDNGKLTITATIVTPDATRVTYDVDNDAHTITPAWTVGDKIIGFDNDGHKFTFTVSKVDGGTGRAVLNTGAYAKGGATKIYAIYAPGYEPEDFGGSASDYTLDVDLGTQNLAVLTEDSPVLMCATADITAGGATLSFENQTAIIGVTKFKLPAAATVTSVSVDGLITTGTFELNGSGDLVLTPGMTPATVSATGSWATGEGNICTTPLYFATLPTDDAKIVLNASDGANVYYNLSAIATTDIEAGNYYYMAKNFVVAVADVAGVKYNTIDAAWEAANAATEDATITLLANCTSAGMLSLNSTASGTGAVTLDLNGRTLTVTPTGSKGIEIDGTRSLTVRDGASGGKIVSSAQYMVYATGTAPGGAIKQFILQSGSLNGTYDGSSNSTALHLITNNGKFEITGGSISATNTNYRGIYLGNNSTLDVNNLTVNTSAYCVYVAIGTINLDGGTFNRTGTYCVYTSNESSVANISAGTYSHTSSGNPLIYADKGVINVTGGYFEAVNVRPVNCAGTSASDGVAYVTDGCFNKPLMTEVLKDKSANEYVNVHNTDGGTSGTYPFTVSAVSSTPKVATLAQGSNSWDFGTIEGAMKGADVRAKANGHSTVTLTDDCSAASTMSVSAGNTYAVILDLAQHSITSTAPGSAISTASTFVLNNTGATTGEITSSATTLTVTAGTATINGGSLYGTTNAASVSSGATLTINNGYFFGAGGSDISSSGTVSISAGRFNHEVAPGWLADGCVSSTEDYSFKERSYNNKVAAASIVATVNGEGYANLAAAAAAATAYSGGEETVTLQLLDDITHNDALLLTNASKPVILDLNGYTLITTTEGFITTNNTLTIKDTGHLDNENTVYGKITSSAYHVIEITSTGTININACVIECTATDQANVNSTAAIWQDNTSSHIVLNDAVVYTINKVSVIMCKNGHLTINGESEVACTKATAGYPAVCSYGGQTGSDIIINGGSFYSSIDVQYNSTITHGASGSNSDTGMLTIHGGYFYYKGTKADRYPVRARFIAQNPNITVDGGYFSKELYHSNTPANDITVPDGYSRQSVTPSVSHPFTKIPALVSVECLYASKVDVTPTL